MAKTWSLLLLLVCDLLQLARGVERLHHHHKRLTRNELKFIPTSVAEVDQQPMNGGFVGTRPVEIVLSHSTTPQPWWVPAYGAPSPGTARSNTQNVIAGGGYGNGYGNGYSNANGNGGYALTPINQQCTQCMTNGEDYCISTNRCVPRATEYCMSKADHITGDAQYSAQHQLSMTCPGGGANVQAAGAAAGANGQVTGGVNGNANPGVTVDQAGNQVPLWAGTSTNASANGTNQIPEGSEPSQQQTQVTGVVGVAPQATQSANATAQTVPAPAPPVAFPSDPSANQGNIPIGHILAVLGGALVIIFLPAAYVYMQGKNPASYEKDVGDTGAHGAGLAEAGAGLAEASEAPPPPPTEAPPPLVQS